MERSRFSSAKKRQRRQARRNRAPTLSAVYTLITLLLICILVILHAKLSDTSDRSSVSRRASDSTLQKRGDILQRNGTVSGGEAAKRKLTKTRLNHLSTDRWVEDTAMDDEADTGTGKEEDSEVFKQNEQVQQEKPVEAKGDVNIFKNSNENSVVHEVARLPTWVSSNMTASRLPLGAAQVVQQPVKNHGFLLKTLPRWDPLEIIGDRVKGQTSEKFSWRSPMLPALKWDHLRGVVRQMRNLQGSLKVPQSRKARLSFKTALLPDLRGSSLEDVHIIDSDDKPLNWNVIDNLERIATIDDALLLRIEKSKKIDLRSWIERKIKMDMFKKDRSSKGFVDMLNPLNNPLLQDPDTSSPNGLNGNDRAILKALRKASAKGKEAEASNTDTVFHQNVFQDMLATTRKHGKTLDTSGNSDGQPGNAAERSILELSKPAIEERDNTDTLMIKQQKPLSDLTMEEKANSILDTRKWGFYPGLDTNLAFSEFLEQFLEDNKCSHRIFMVWTTPPWTYTIRYQRGLESVLYFHPHACVAVFSNSIELDFFKSFVEQGFRVAVVVPNLEELLAGTPAVVFSAFWLAWTKTKFFHIHYSELIRLAVLYKYGGIYLDTDVVLLKPLAPLHNTIGAENSENGNYKLNGAVMAFNKHSMFLWECLIEFTKTYDDKLLEFNGAELVTRVADRMKETPGDHTEQIHIEEPHVFFPLTRDDVTRFFRAPEVRKHRLEMSVLLKSIYNHSSMLHFWNQKTHFLLPEVSSLAEIILNQHCIRCNEYL